MQPCGPNKHEWAPCSQWGARYRCDKCKCFGYVPSMVRPPDIDTRHSQSVRDNQIIPYKCSHSTYHDRVKGTCGAPATHKKRGRTHKTHDWRCSAHHVSMKKKPHDVFCPECNARPTQLCRKKNKPVRSIHGIRKIFAANWDQYDIELVVPPILTEEEEYAQEAIASTECIEPGCGALPGEPCDPWMNEEEGLCHHARLVSCYGGSRYGGGPLRALNDPRIRPGSSG